MQLLGGLGSALLGKLGSCEPRASMCEYQQDEVCIWDSRDAERGGGVIADKQRNSRKPWEKGQMEFLCANRRAGKGREVDLLLSTQLLKPVAEWCTQSCSVWMF